MELESVLKIGFRIKLQKPNNFQYDGSETDEKADRIKEEKLIWKYLEALLNSTINLVLKNISMTEQQKRHLINDLRDKYVMFVQFFCLFLRAAAGSTANKINNYVAKRATFWANGIRCFSNSGGLYQITKGVSLPPVDNETCSEFRLLI